MLLEKICKELGVKIGEEWGSIDGNSYCILNDGSIEVNGVTKGYQYWKDIFSGLVKPKWKPEIGETCYIPYIHSKEEERQLQYIWEEGRRTDKFLWDNNLVFKTKEEAIEASNKMIKTLKEG